MADFFDEPAPEPTVEPNPEPIADPGGDGVVTDQKKRRQPTCLDRRPYPSYTNGPDDGWTYYAPTGAKGQATGAEGCFYLGFSDGGRSNARGPGMAEARARAEQLYPGAKGGKLVNSCHLIPGSTGGLGLDGNLSPCWRAVNVGGMDAIESEIRKLVKDDPRDLVVDMSVKPECLLAGCTIPHYYRYRFTVRTRDGQLVDIHSADVENEYNGHYLDGSR